MNIERQYLSVSGLRVEIVRKDIQNLHLGVYPPDGRVRAAVPSRMSDEAARLAVISRLPWIRKQRAQFAAQPRQSAREIVSGESHYFLGKRYRLRVVRQEGPAKVFVRGKSRIELHVRDAADLAERERALLGWYRRALRETARELLAKWQDILGVQVADCRIKRMKTRWGTCSVDAGRIWLNLELAKKPVPCIEYVLVHELTHLLERTHSERFVALMDRHLPQWRSIRDELNTAPLAHESWQW